MPSGFIAGMTAPQYGMPMVGTPIGLPGPPHVPLGGPAGLKRHTIVNHTRVNVPEPSKHVRIDVKQSPGISYPRPANWAIIHERSTPGVGVYHQPSGEKRELVGNGGGVGGACPVGPGVTGAFPTGGAPGAMPAAASGPACATGASN
jgi:hypothetical protein